MVPWSEIINHLELPRWVEFVEGDLEEGACDSKEEVAVHSRVWGFGSE